MQLKHVAFLDYHNKGNKKHELGCGFYVKGEFLKYVKDFKAIKKKIMLAEIKGKMVFLYFDKRACANKWKNQKRQKRNLIIY
jgi:hypothetical protein